MAAVHLIASSDDYLLAERLAEVVSSASTALGGVEPEILDEEITPEELATALCSPSLFDPQRVLVLRDARAWLEKPKSAGTKSGRSEVVDTNPVVVVLEDGVSEDIALVIGASCGSKPRGALVAAFEAAGTFEWQAVPAPPKPWEDTAVSEEQERVLRRVITRAAPDVAFDKAAVRLLIDRLGYEPRQLAQEARKLAAAGEGSTVSEALVRDLCFPKERSLEVVRDAVFARTPAPILDLISAGEAGVVVRDYRGGLLKPEHLPATVAGQVGALLQQMLYLRRLVTRMGAEHELSPSRTGEPRWYPRHFKNGFGPGLMKELGEDAPSPVAAPGKKLPGLFALGFVFRGASRYADDELVDALAAFGPVEAAMRGEMAAEALSAFLARVLPPAS